VTRGGGVGGVERLLGWDGNEFAIVKKKRLGGGGMRSRAGKRKHGKRQQEQGELIHFVVKMGCS